jgi:hypothetical protein
MPTNDDTFWDELGLSWRASFREPEVISRRLETRLKLQGFLLTGTTALGVAGSLFGFALAAWTLWIGWSHHIGHFVSRGATLAMVSLLAATATTLTLRMRSGLETRSLREMLQISIARTARLIKVADVGMCMVLVLAVGGTIGYVLRTRFGHPPAVTLAEDILLVAVVGLALAWYRRTEARALRRYKHLAEAFASDTARDPSSV